MQERWSTSSRGFLVEWLVDADASEIARLNLDVVLAIAGFENDPCDGALSFGYAPISAGLRQAA